jgi:8-oxo-dGTP pyrophosphatase MutT (NUDIX family)
MPTDFDPIHQAAAIPIKEGHVCLVTSRSGKRWVIPKGCLEPGKTAGEIALQEAWEEAGLAGILQGQPVGSYLYEKYGMTHHVTVFIIQVTQAADNWPERSVRDRDWVTPSQAIDRIDDRGLREIIRSTVLEWEEMRA